MNRRPTPRIRPLALVFAALALFATTAFAQPFVITLPTSGSAQPVGQPIAITWSGGVPSSVVHVSLFDVAAATSVAGPGFRPNNGFVFVGAK